LEWASQLTLRTPPRPQSTSAWPTWLAPSAWLP